MTFAQSLIICVVFARKYLSTAPEVIDQNLPKVFQSRATAVRSILPAFREVLESLTKFILASFSAVVFSFSLSVCLLMILVSFL